MRDRTDAFFAAFAVLAVVVNVALLAAIVFVAWHFIGKYW